MSLILLIVAVGGLILALGVLGQRLGSFDGVSDKRIPGIKCRCGHEEWETKIWFGGRRIFFRPPDYGDRFCAECFKKYAKLCPACGRVILPGDWVSICVTSGGFRPKGPRKLRFSLGGNKFVLCNEPGCIRTGVESEEKKFWDGARFLSAPSRSRETA